MQKTHPLLIPKYEEHKQNCSTEAIKRKTANRGFTSYDRTGKRPKFIQPTLKQNISLQTAKPIAQGESDLLIQNYIVNSLSPISHVEHPSFIALVHGYAPYVKIPSRRTLNRRIEENERAMIQYVKQQLGQADFVCTTADAWTGFKNRRSFLGVTAHILNDDLSRKSFALACRFFPGKHTYDRIGNLLSKIHDEFGINANKITCCVTDNGSNFVKAFKEFQVELIENNDDMDENDAVEGIDMNDLLESSQSTEESSMLEIDEESDEDVDAIILPRHQKCASHTLNLVGCNAPTAAAKVNAKYRSVMHSSNGKCSAIWNKVNSPQSNEIISSVLGCQLVTPVATRWNSYYDSRRSLLLHSEEKLTALCEALQLPVFKEVEIAFMKEDLQVLTPLAQGLDRLQGQTNSESYMAFLFPTLLQLKHSYQQLTASTELKYCSCLANVILYDITTRFDSYFTFSESSQSASLASITHPAFKLRWLKPEVLDEMKNLFLNTLTLCANQELEQSSSQTVNTTSAYCALDSQSLDYFTFMQNTEEHQSTSVQSQAQLEGMQYLEDGDKSVSSLNRYPRVCRMFRKYNVALPSSAAVERLFSIGGMICTAKRNRLSEKLFESLLLQRTNNFANLRQ